MTPLSLMRFGLREVKHFHRYGPWTLKKVGDLVHLPDKEYAEQTRFPPFWVQACDCGSEHWLRARRRPLARTKFREMWGSRVL